MIKKKIPLAGISLRQHRHLIRNSGLRTDSSAYLNWPVHLVRELWVWTWPCPCGPRAYWSTPPVFVRLTPFQTSQAMIAGTSWAGVGKRWPLWPWATRWSQEANAASSITWEHRSRTDVGLNNTAYVSVGKASTGRDPQRHMIIKVSSEMVGFYGIFFSLFADLICS